MKIRDILIQNKDEKVPVGETPYIEIGDINIINKSYIYKDKPSVKGAKYAYKNSIIVSTVRPTRGAIAIINEEKIAVSSGFAILKVDETKCLTKYLFNYINNPSFLEYLGFHSTGATYPTCSKEDILSYEINLPTMEEQIKIANEFEHIYSLINNRKEQINYLNSLIKSKFIDMFGNPVSNSMQWHKIKLNELGYFGRGVSKHRPRNAIELLNGPYPLIQTGDVSNSDLYIIDYNSTYSELGLKQSKMWPKGTLCITIAANIAQTSILTFDACFPDSVVGFIANEKTNNIFMHYWFSFLQKIIDSRASQVAQKNINLQVLSELGVINPPIKLQNEFADLVNIINNLKEKLLDDIDDLEQLYLNKTIEFFERK